MATYLYTRCSTSEQTIENQILAAEKAGYKFDKIFSDEDVSGSKKSTDREQYFQMSNVLKQDDTVVVSEISRIGRKTLDVLQQMEEFKKKGVRVIVLAYGNLDITSDMGEVIVTMAAAMAQMELKDLKRRTTMGMQRTKEQGTKLGPPLKITPDEFDEIVQERKSGMSVDRICIQRKLSAATVYKNLKQWGDNPNIYRQEFKIRQDQHAKAAALRA